MKKEQKGFTLIELLIVIAIVGILAGVVFVALDPLTRFKDARNSNRWGNVTEIMSSIKLNQIDNGGSYISNISSMTNGLIYMIGTDTANCNAATYTCDTALTASACVDLTPLVTAGYLGTVPVSPNGAGSWTAGHTGYTLKKASTGILTVAACEAEGSPEVTVSR